MHGHGHGHRYRRRRTDIRRARCADEEGPLPPIRHAIDWWDQVMPHDDTEVEDWCDQIKQYDDDYWAERHKLEVEEDDEEPPDDPDYVYERDLSKEQIQWYRRSKNHDDAILLLEKMQMKLITGEQKTLNR